MCQPERLPGPLMSCIGCSTFNHLRKGSLDAIWSRGMFRPHVLLSAGHSAQMSNGFGRLPLTSTGPGSGLVRLRRLLWEQEIESSNLSFPTQRETAHGSRRGPSYFLAVDHAGALTDR